MTATIEPALVRSLDLPELKRAFAAATEAVLGEAELADPALADRLGGSAPQRTRQLSLTSTSARVTVAIFSLIGVVVGTVLNAGLTPLLERAKQRADARPALAVRRVIVKPAPARFERRRQDARLQP